MPSSAIYDVAIIGGGASGLAAAIAAARAGDSVVVIERDVELGLPILATGNGRCNLSNANLDPARYSHPEIARHVMGEHPQDELSALFSSIGLMTCEVDGRLYPYSKRADSVREALLAAVLGSEITVLTCAESERATYDAVGSAWHLEISRPVGRLPLPKKSGSELKSRVRALRRELRRAERAREVISSRRAIIACGGSSTCVAELFGLPHVPEEPVLCPVSCAPLRNRPDSRHLSALERLDGLRVDCRVSLVRDGAMLWAESGEVLFRPYGISGIVVFDLSRRCIAGDVVEIDLFPAYGEDELARLFEARAAAFGSPEQMASAWFCGMLDSRLGTHIAAMVEPSGRTCAAYARMCKHLPFEVQGTTEHASAQVRRGGIPFDAVEIPSLSVKPAIAPALSVCGEALDMDADCGGFNLAWAWLSGLRVGAAR